MTVQVGNCGKVAGVNPFKLWSILFLILTSLLSLSIVIHDLALSPRLHESVRRALVRVRAHLRRNTVGANFPQNEGT